MKKFLKEKNSFFKKINSFSQTLAEQITDKNQWTIRGFIDVSQNIYVISPDTKVISKILELHLFPLFMRFAEENGFTIELASHQNWYPDLTFISKANPKVKFAVDLKTTYRDEDNPQYCNGFTLGSHGEYFTNRQSTKNIQYPYNSYAGHFCLGIIYSRAELDRLEETKKYSIDDLNAIPPTISQFTFFVQEKWRIASDTGGSGNTANIGSITFIDDILSGNGVFAKAGEAIFDDYWANYKKMPVTDSSGNHKPLSSFKEYLLFKGLPSELNNEKHTKKTDKKKGKKIGKNKNG